jgi:hypothetical protein
MSRRATLPGADELFRRTSGEPVVEEASQLAQPGASGVAVLDGPAETAASATGGDNGSGEGTPGAESARRPSARRRPRAGDRRPTGRERHEEKITVYVSPEELVDLEQAKLVLRAQHGLAVDRGRIVREAMAMVIADLEAKGEESILVRRLRGV